MENELPNISTTADVHGPQIPTRRRAQDFISRYSNNIQLESSAFDLKLVFGLIDQRDAPTSGKPSVEQHTAMNLSWTEVKLLIFFLRLHLAGYETDNGKVKVPLAALPPEPPSELSAEFDNPQSRKGIDLIRKMRAEFLASLSEP